MWKLPKTAGRRARLGIAPAWWSLQVSEGAVYLTGAQQTVSLDATLVILALV
jgi:hypothetical protein